MEKSVMKQTFDDGDLRQFSLTLDIWKILAKFLGVPNSNITYITLRAREMQNLGVHETACMGLSLLSCLLPPIATSY